MNNVWDNDGIINVLLFKYSRMHKKIAPQLVCGSRGACLDSMLPGVQVTTGLGFFLCLSVSDDSDSPVVMRCIPF